MVGMHRMVPQDISFTKAGGCHVPGGVAPGVVGGPQAPGGEGGGVRLPLDQLLARQLEQGLALHRGGEEGVVLLRSDAGKGLEPMSIVGSPFLQRPILHGVGHHIGGAHADAAAILHHIGHFGKHLLGRRSRMTETLNTFVPNSSVIAVLISSQPFPFP